MNLKVTREITDRFLAIILRASFSFLLFLTSKTSANDPLPICFVMVYCPTLLPVRSISSDFDLEFGKVSNVKTVAIE